MPPKNRVSTKILYILIVCISSLALWNILFAVKIIEGTSIVSLRHPILFSSKPFTQDDPGKRHKEILLLNSTDASSIRLKEEVDAQKRNSPYSIDILIVGSANKTDFAKVQRETWASHGAVRHFFLSTEYDDTNPKCSEDYWSNEDIVQYTRPCRSGQFWKSVNARNILTKNVKFGRFKWLKKKADPKGWICAQKRFVTSFTSLIQIYAETKSLPDYFILADDDTYVNMDHILKMMITDPKKYEENGGNLEMIRFPPSNTPVVTAGCRARASDHLLTWIFPFGGFGVFFSKGSLERLIQPLHCGDNVDEFEQGTCAKLLHKEENASPMNITIAEERFFEVGDSLNKVFYKYARNIDHFCVHSDWFIGYISNFYNISRHTIGGTYWDDKKMDVQENRLHTFEDSEIYDSNSRTRGQCAYGGEHGKECDEKATVCHHVNITTFREIHSKALLQSK
jgi:hypothetical protein